jgi:putative transposase
VRRIERVRAVASEGARSRAQQAEADVRGAGDGETGVEGPARPNTVTPSEERDAAAYVRTAHRVLTAIDHFTRECLCLEARFHRPATTVTAALDHAIARRAAPGTITCDNGSEFTSSHVDAWADRHQIRLDFIAPGRPIENTYIESFNGKAAGRVSGRALVCQPRRGACDPGSVARGVHQNATASSLDDLVPEVFAARWLAVADA